MDKFFTNFQNVVLSLFPEVGFQLIIIWGSIRTFYYYTNTFKEFMSQDINSQEPVPENDEPNVAYNSGPNTSSSQSPQKNANFRCDPFV